jgi:hypothetical protein
MQATRQALLEKLFRSADPFATWKNHSGKRPDHSYPHTGLPPQVVKEAIQKLRDHDGKTPLELIVEVGSFKGGSASILASAVKEMGVSATVLCVDTFLGDTNMRADHNGWLDWLALEGGHPTVYDQFMANIIDRGHQDVVLPLVASSTVGLRVLDRLGFKCGISYLDSAHEADETLLELKLLTKLTHHGGIIIGDDFSWPSVRGDVCEFIMDRRLSMAVHLGQYYAIEIP